MKEAGYADELKILEKFKDSRNEWFVKEEKKKKSRKSTPKVQAEEGSSSQPKKRQKKNVETMLVDEPDEEEPVTNVEETQESDIDDVLKNIEYDLEADKVVHKGVGADEDKSSSSSESEVDETERMKRIQAEIEKEKQLKRKRRQEKDDDVYVPSPEHVTESQTPLSGGRKKASAKKSVVSPRAASKKLILRLPKRTPKTKQSQPPSPPKSPHQSPPKQPTPPRQPTPHQSPFHLSPLPQSPPHLSPQHQTPIQEKLVLTSQQIFQTPPPSQPRVQLTPGSSSFKHFPNVPGNISLDEIGDFGFANDEQVKKLEKKMDDVLVENKRLVDREKILEMRVKKVESENKSLLKKIEADQTEIDILKVKVAELEEEKERRDEQNKYFELKNKELEAAKAMKEHEIYMMNKVLENMLGKSVEQRFEEIEVEEVRAKHQAEIDAEMKFKGKGVEGSEVSERSIVPSTIPESPIQNPRPISAVSAIFEEDVLLEDVINDEGDDEEDDEEEDDEDDDEEHDEEDKVDDADDVFSASSHSDDGDDDDDQGGTGIKVTEASDEQNVDDYMHDDANEDHESAEGEGEHVDDQNVDKVEKLILRLEPEVEEGEFRHVYTMNDIKEMTRIADPDFKFDFEEELNAFDINQQPDYEYKYVEEADVYDRVEVEDCTDEENVNEDISNFPTLVEFFSQENRDELRRKVAEILKDKNFDCTTKNPQQRTQEMVP
ncbi:glutamic acid-rich protein-like [Helianthus annuus]|uniref:glutamic acid-rich protein-like n=1 Tax=Helianthus annuus TaxID=4232 RepID=UPI000B8F58AA|nr:glutamic acid-rich protein-like [Helianthus annuus]